MNRLKKIAQLKFLNRRSCCNESPVVQVCFALISLSNFEQKGRNYVTSEQFERCMFPMHRRIERANGMLFAKIAAVITLRGACLPGGSFRWA
jgi:hypothetical protein